MLNKVILFSFLVFFTISNSVDLFAQERRPRPRADENRPTNRSSRTIKASVTKATTRPRADYDSNTTRIIGGVKKISNRHFVWVLSSNNNEGHWVSARPGEVEKYNKSKKPYFSPNIDFSHIKSFYSEYNRELNIEIDKLDENLNWIYNPKRARNIEGKPAPSERIRGEAEKLSVTYFDEFGKKNFTSFTGYGTQILVTDTIHAPVSFLSADRDRPNIIKIIANSIVYENPLVFTSLVTRGNTNYVITARTIKFRSAIPGIAGNQLTPPPPLFIQDGNVKVLKDSFGDNERLLLNRLFIHLMEQQKTMLRSENDDWKKDLIASNFQNYRFKVLSKHLGKDPEFMAKFNELVSNFNDEYPKRIGEIRSIDSNPIFISGQRDKMHEQGLQYYVLPRSALLQPIRDPESGDLVKLGIINYTPTGENNLTLEITAKMIVASNVSKKNGINLQSQLPDSIFGVKHQPIVINGKFDGTASPISNELIKLRINLPDDGQSLIELFPSGQGGSFFMNFDLRGREEGFNQKIRLTVPDELLVSNNFEEMLDLFNVYESNTITENIKVSSQLDPYNDQLDEALQYVEFNLDINFDNKITKRGPFRLSSYSTISSEIEIPFVKHSSNFEIILNGTAHYENGSTIDFKYQPEKNSSIILLTEQNLK